MADGRGTAGTAADVLLNSDDIGGTWTDIVKLAFGALNTATLVSGSNGLPVEIVAGSSAGTEYAEDSVHNSGDMGTMMLVVRQDSQSDLGADGDYVPLTVNGDGELRVTTAAGSGTSAADDADFVAGTTAGTPAMGVYESTPTSVTDGDLGTVGITQTRALRTVVEGTAAVSNAGLTELAAAINASSQMDVNIAASGATVPISHAALTELAAAIDTEMQVDIVGALPAGTNAIGKLAANSGVDIGDVDVISLPALVAGTAYIGKTLPPDRDVTLHTAYAKKYYTSAGAATDGIIWSPASGTRWHVVSMFVNTSAACTFTLEDDKAGGDEVVLKAELAANSGYTINFGEHYPLASGEDAADLIVTTSAGNIYITVTGYEI